MRAGSRCSLGLARHAGHGLPLLVLLLLLPLAELLLYHLLVVMFVPLVVSEVNLVSLFGLLNDVEVYLDPPPLHVLTIHLEQGFLGGLMGVKLYVSKALRLLGHPVVGKSDGLDATEAAEAVTHIVLLEGVR